MFAFAQVALYERLTTTTEEASQGALSLCQPRRIGDEGTNWMTWRRSAHMIPTGLVVQVRTASAKGSASAEGHQFPLKLIFLHALASQSLSWSKLTRLSEAKPETSYHACIGRQDMNSEVSL